jgi:hypothetical protein
MTAEREMQIHPSQRLTAPDGVQVDIDDDMVALVRVLWSLDLKTTACCQDFGEGTAGQREAKPHPSRYSGDAFIAFYMGYAWLKMPVADAQLLADLLLSTEFRNEVILRWTPGSWRMHVPMIFNEHRGIVLSNTAQIHFPREQIPRLTSVLENIRKPLSTRVQRDN